MKFEDYVLLYLFLGNPNNKKIPFSKVRFWAITFLIVNTGLKIQMENGHYLTIFDCFIEMEDVLEENIFEGGNMRAWWE